MKIYVDKREKYPWDFTPYHFDQEYITLETGDYYVEEIPHLIIERKRSTGEIATNLGTKWKPFHEELKRMSDFREAYIICEFPLTYLDDFPKNSGVPKNKHKFLRMNANYIKSKLFQNTQKYNIQLIFSNSPEEALAKTIEIINAEFRQTYES